jgi:ferredoxin
VARIGIVGSAARVEASPAISLLNTLLAAGERIRHDCGGKALCGTCAVKVVDGSGALSPVAPLEAARLAASGRGEGWRLACQARAVRDVRIEIPPEGSAGGGEA